EEAMSRVSVHPAAYGSGVPPIRVHWRPFAVITSHHPPACMGCIGPADCMGSMACMGCVSKSEQSSAQNRHFETHPKEGRRLLAEDDVVHAQRGAGLPLVLTHRLVVIGPGADLGSLGLGQLLLQVEHLEGRAGAGAELLLAGVEALLGEPRGFAGGLDALARGDDL